MPPALRFDPIAEARRQWSRRWGENACASMAAVTSIMRAQQILMTRLNELLRPLDLTFPRYEALMLLFLGRTGALPLGKMGARLQVHRTSVTNIVDQLERSGYVRRVPHDADRRTVLASITPAGRAVAERATEALNAARFGTEPLDDEDLDRLAETLLELRVRAGDFEA